MSEKITLQNGKLIVPDQPVICYIEGDGTGPDIWAASQKVLDAGVAKAYGGKRRIEWLEILAAEKARSQAAAKRRATASSCPNACMVRTAARFSAA